MRLHLGVRVEIWSDVVCPWCYIGKRRFESALAGFPHRDEITVVWRSFELDPTAPPSPEEPGRDVGRLAAKYRISLDHAQAMQDRVLAIAAGEGLQFRFDRIRGGNTFDAHRLLHLALAHGVQDDLKERLDHATFTEGLPVSDHAALTQVAVAAALDETEVRDVLSSDRYADAVRADEAQASAYGITGVPFFAIDARFGVAGAQPADLLRGALTQAWPERSPITPVVGPTGDDEACTDDSCAI